MDDRLIELYVRRGRLRERIGAQRVLLARDLAPVAAALGVADQGMAWVRRAKAYVQQRPGVVAAVVVALMVWRPRWMWRPLRWAWLGWRVWRGKGQQAHDLFRAMRRMAGAPPP
ncbi:MAG: hypothetical protein RLZ81_419 [Pseudomonadota bacterium]|jgi:hypothetical protein